MVAEHPSELSEKYPNDTDPVHSNVASGGMPDTAGTIGAVPIPLETSAYNHVDREPDVQQGFEKADMQAEHMAIQKENPLNHISADGNREKPAESQVTKKKKKGLFGRKAKDDSVAVKTKQEEKPKEPTVSLLTLYRYHTPLEKLANIFGVLLAIAAGAALPLMTLIFGRLTTSFTQFTQTILQAGGNFDAPTVVAARSQVLSQSANNASYLVYIGIGMIVCTYGYMVIWEITSEKAARRIREKFLKATLRQEVSFFDDLGSGEIATRIESDTHLVATGISSKFPIAVQFISTFFTGYILAYVKCWRLALAVSSMLPAIMSAGAFMGRSSTRFTQGGASFIADAGSLAEEAFASIRTVHAMGAQKSLNDLFDAHIAKAVTIATSGAKISSIGFAGVFFVIYSGYALAFYFGAKLIDDGHANAGTIITVFLSILFGSFSIAQLVPELQAVAKARGGAAKLYSIIERKSAIDSESNEGLRPDSCEGRITFENVVFNYPSRPDVPILKSLTTVFPPYSTTALVGASGSGKSSIIALMERFYDPQSGIVKLDGRDVKTLNVKWLRTQIGLVSQEPVLFGMSIRKNIEAGLINSTSEFASPDAKFELIKKAAVLANAHDFIIKLPQGYDTEVGQAGLLLSGGQKQRVAIARAIVSDPPILLLDEATSALDSRSEQAVQIALDEAARGRTCITVAHRLSTIAKSKKILVVGAGEIIEEGTHDELMERAGAYAGMVEAQRMRQETDKANKEIDDDLIYTKGTQTPASTTDTDARGELERRSTQQSVTSAIIARKGDVEDQRHEPELYSLFYLAKRCYQINRQGKWNYIAGIIGSICVGAVYPAIAIVFGHVISNFALTGKDLENAVDRNALYYFITAILAAISIWFQQSCLNGQGEILTGKLRSIYFASLMRQDIAFYNEEDNTTGALTSALSDNPQKVQGLAGVTMGTIIQSCSTVVVGIIVSLSTGPLLALIGIACIPFLISAGYIRLKVVILKDQRNKLIYSRTAHMASEAAGAIRTVASLTRETECCREYNQALDGPTRKSIRSAYSTNLLYAISQGLSFWVISLIFYVGSRWLASGRYNSRQFFTVMNSIVLASIQAGNVFQFVPDASKAKSACSTIVKIIDSIPEIDAQSEEGQHLNRQDVRGDIAFQNVHFRYPTRPGIRVLRGLDIKVPAGRSVALVGPSGCGKSTTVSLMERFYDPLSGRVTLDGTDLSSLNVGSFRSHMSIVSQEPTLYRGSIKFNILLGANKPAAEVTQEELVQACKDANIYDFIMSLPDQFETSVGGKGSQLSGGQKQRVAIARALIRNPKILLLDEATSALDSQSERVVSEVLEKAQRGRSSIIIAHRLSSIQNADLIYFIKDGQVTEVGTHQELLAAKGGYYELVVLQTLSKQA